MTYICDVEIQLSEQPDGYGFYYGIARKGDAVVRVNILPPVHLWSGDVGRSMPTASCLPASLGKKTWCRRLCHCSRAGKKKQLHSDISNRSVQLSSCYRSLVCHNAYHQLC